MENNITQQRLDIYDQIINKDQIILHQEYTLFLLESGKRIKIGSQLLSDPKKSHNPENYPNDWSAQNFVKERNKGTLERVDYIDLNDLKTEEKITKNDLEDIIKMMPSKDYEFGDKKNNQSIRELILLIGIFESNNGRIKDRHFTSRYNIANDEWGDYDFWQCCFLGVPIYDIENKKTYIHIHSENNLASFDYTPSWFDEGLYSPALAIQLA